MAGSTSAAGHRLAGGRDLRQRRQIDGAPLLLERSARTSASVKAALRLPPFGVSPNLCAVRCPDRTIDNTGNRSSGQAETAGDRLQKSVEIRGAPNFSSSFRSAVRTRAIVAFIVISLIQSGILYQLSQFLWSQLSRIARCLSRRISCSSCTERRSGVIAPVLRLRFCVPSRWCCVVVFGVPIGVCCSVCSSAFVGRMLSADAAARSHTSGSTTDATRRAATAIAQRHTATTQRHNTAGTDPTHSAPDAHPSPLPGARPQSAHHVASAHTEHTHSGTQYSRTQTQARSRTQHDATTRNTWHATLHCLQRPPPPLLLDRCGRPVAVPVRCPVVRVRLDDAVCCSSTGDSDGRDERRGGGFRVADCAPVLARAQHTRSRRPNAIVSGHEHRQQRQKWTQRDGKREGRFVPRACSRRCRHGTSSTRPHVTAERRA